MIETSPAMKRAVAGALKKMELGQSDKKKTAEDTNKMLAERRKTRHAEHQEYLKGEAKNLPAMEKEHAELESKYQKLGGSNYRYADKERSMTAEEKEARRMEPHMSRLGATIAEIKQAGYKKGGKINLKHCSVSTAEKGKKHHCW